MTPVFLIHHGELVLKGGNRRQFERRLITNMRVAVEGLPVRVESVYGRTLVHFESQDAYNTHRDETLASLQRVFGISHIVIAQPTSRSVEAFSEAAVTLLSAVGGGSFAVRASRSDKSFPQSSEVINREVGAAVVEQSGRSVDLTAPDHTVHIVITDYGSYVGVERVPGAGGLPHGTAGRVLSLLSSGIDSPVSSYRMMKRGARVFYLHFHSYPMTSQSSIDNTKQIVEVLQRSQPNAQLLLAPLAELQKQVVANAPEKLRVVLYRMAMFQVAERLARRVKARALVTGESLSQVASQTLVNMTVTSHGIRLPILRPLIGMDKQEIVDESEQIGTYDISVLPYEDCCSLLLPDRVATHAELPEVLEAIDQLPWDELVADVVKRTEIVAC